MTDSTLQKGKPKKKSAKLSAVQTTCLTECHQFLQALETNGHQRATSLAVFLVDAFPEVFGADAPTPAPLDPAQRVDTLSEDDGERMCTPVAFPHSDSLDPLHPRIQAFCKVRQCPSRPRSIVDDPTWQLNCLWERWRCRVGELDFGRWKKAMLPALQVYEFESIWNAIEAFREHGKREQQRGYPVKFPAFCESLRTYVQTGLMPYKNAAGDLTVRGRQVFGDK